MCFCLANLFFWREGDGEGPSNFLVCKYCLLLHSNVFHPSPYIFQEERFHAFQNHCTWLLRIWCCIQIILTLKGKKMSFLSGCNRLLKELKCLFLYVKASPWPSHTSTKTLKQHLGFLPLFLQGFRNWALNFWGGMAEWLETNFLNGLFKGRGAILLTTFLGFLNIMQLKWFVAL